LKDETHNIEDLERALELLYLAWYNVEEVCHYPEVNQILFDLGKITQEQYDTYYRPRKGVAAHNDVV
jgi:hypothetical protein